MDASQVIMADAATANAPVFIHEAMNTTFTLRLPTSDHHEASAIARECFDLVDFLEQRLSRYVESSDVSRINAMRQGETLRVSEPTHRCLLLALDAWTATSGLFDVTHGTRFEHVKQSSQDPLPQIFGSLVIHPDTAAVTCAEAGRVIDLGGIGKGFALDEIARLLIGWDVHDAFVAAGASSMLALGNIEWPVDLAGNHSRLRILLSNASLSASGSGIQGCHIVHPDGHGAMPLNASQRIWVIAKDAALAEVWSTALMLVDPSQIAQRIHSTSGIHIVYAEDPSGCIRERSGCTDESAR
jgi:thiamine biosynthesis lipoprotein